MFAYCNNNAPNRVDFGGNMPKELLGIFPYTDGGGGSCGVQCIPTGYKGERRNIYADTESAISMSSDIFGVGVVQANSYEAFSLDILLAGAESGFSTAKTICGNVSKPISVFAQAASSWWKVQEFKAGVQFNVGSGGYSIAMGMGETSVSFSVGNGKTIEIMYGINKLGITVSYDADFGDHSAGTYKHIYIRSIPTVALALLFAYCPEIATALVPAVAG